MPLFSSQKEQLPRLAELLDQAEDVWTFPLPEEELRYRFCRWQRKYKTPTVPMTLLSKSYRGDL